MDDDKPKPAAGEVMVRALRRGCTDAGQVIEKGGEFPCPAERAKSLGWVEPVGGAAPEAPAPKPKSKAPAPKPKSKAPAPKPKGKGAK